MGCHHAECGICVKCEGETDACCGEDFQCDECGNHLCNSCYNDFNEQCPVCAKEIVTDSQLVTFLLKKFNLQRQAIVEEFRAEAPVYRPLVPTLTDVRPLCESSIFYEIPARMMEKLRLVPDALGRDIMDRGRQVIVGDLRLKGQNYRVIHGFFDKNAVAGQNSNNDDFIDWGAFGVIAPTVSGRWNEYILYQMEYEQSSFVPGILQRLADARNGLVTVHEPIVQQAVARQVVPGLICYVGEMSHLNSEYDLSASKVVRAAHEWYQTVTKNGTDYSAPWWRLQSDESDEDQNNGEQDEEESAGGHVEMVQPVAVALPNIFN